MSAGGQHPCLSCPLPECDDADRRCSLRQALAEYSRTRKRRREISDALRARYTIAYHEIYGIERNARRQDRSAADARN